MCFVATSVGRWERLGNSAGNPVTLFGAAVVNCGDEVSTITLPSFEFKTAFQALPGRDCGNWVSCQFSIPLQLLQSLISETLGQKTDSLLCAGHDGIFLIGSQAGNTEGTARKKQLKGNFSIDIAKIQKKTWR